MTADVRQHPDLADLIERSETPDIAAHLATCATCRARHRLLTQDSGAPPPGLEEARKAMARARLTVSRTDGHLGTASCEVFLASQDAMLE